MVQDLGTVVLLDSFVLLLAYFLDTLHLMSLLVV